jgi:hypothetical protein
MGHEIQFTAAVMADPKEWPIGVQKRAIVEDGHVVVRMMLGQQRIGFGDWVVVGKDGSKRVVTAAEAEARAKAKEEKRKK